VIALSQNGKGFHFSYEIFAEIDEAVYNCALLPRRLRQSLGIITGLRWREFGNLVGLDLRDGSNELTIGAGSNEGYMPLCQGGGSTVTRKYDTWELFHAPC
jgi:hypothetical protein